MLGCIPLQRGRSGRETGQSREFMRCTHKCTWRLWQLTIAALRTRRDSIKRKGTFPSDSLSTRCTTPYTSSGSNTVAPRTRCAFLSNVRPGLRPRAVPAVPMSWPSLACFVWTRNLLLLLLFSSSFLLRAVPFPSNPLGSSLLETAFRPGEHGFGIPFGGTSTYQTNHTAERASNTNPGASDVFRDQKKRLPSLPREASEVISAEVTIASLFEFTPSGKQDSLKSPTEPEWPIKIVAGQFDSPLFGAGRSARTATILSSVPLTTVFPVKTVASWRDEAGPKTAPGPPRRLQVQSSMTSLARFFLPSSFTRYPSRSPEGKSIISPAGQRLPTDNEQVSGRHRVKGGTATGNHWHGSVTRSVVPYPAERQYTLKELEIRFNQLGPEELALLSRRVAEKALSHLDWFYTWQKEHAPGLLLAEQDLGTRSPPPPTASERLSPSAPEQSASSLGSKDRARNAIREKPAVTALKANGPKGEEETFSWDFGWTGQIDSDVILPEDEEGNSRIHGERARGTPGARSAGPAGWAEVHLGGEEGVAEGQALWDQTAIALQRKNIPNVTLTVDRLNDEVSVFLERYRDAVWSLPLQEIVNVTLNGGMFPELVERQNSSYPDIKRNVECNPNVQVCQNLGNFLREFGNNLRGIYRDSYPYGLHRRAEELAGLLHYVIVSQTVTEALFEFVEQHVTVSALEAVLNMTSSLIEIPVESQVFSLLNALLALGGDFYSLADPPAADFENKNIVRSKVRNAFYCRLFNGRLRFCNPGVITGPSAPDIPRETVFDPATGFIKFLYMQGFNFSCENQGTCFADVSIEGDNFDGFYVLQSVGTTGFPVYVGYRQFRNFPELRRIYFWQGLRPSVIDATQASWAAITPFFPESYYAATRGQLFPFASLATLTPPNNCTDEPPVPFGDTNTNFPACLNITDSWVVGRVAAFGNCNGFLYSHVCVFPAIVQVFPTSNPDTWTSSPTTTTTSSPAVPEPGQPGPSPPGGGVPPGGPPRVSPTPTQPQARLPSFPLFSAGADSLPSSKENPLEGISSRNGNGHRAKNERRLAGGASFDVAGQKLQHLTGMNGRRFHSAVPVHRSQFVDGFSGKLDIYIPPFFHIPPSVWEEKQQEHD